MDRRPLAVANWKMAMNLRETLDFATTFVPAVADWLTQMDVVVCPPFTALWFLAAARRGAAIQLGAQNLYAGAGVSYTGEISAELLADVGCAWVLLGHWERRRHFGETDALVNRKVHAALEAGLRPIVLIGEPRDAGTNIQVSIEAQLARVLAAVSPEQVAKMAFIYEPEGAIGQAEPVAPADVARGARWIREWIGRHFGETVAASVRIIYGGSVTPRHAPVLLAHGDVDGLGAGRKGRDAVAFAEIVQLIAQSKL